MPLDSNQDEGAEGGGHRFGKGWSSLPTWVLMPELSVGAG